MTIVADGEAALGKLVEVEDTYVRVTVDELRKIEATERGVVVEFRLKYGDATFKLKKVRIAGTVVDVSRRGRMLELALEGEGARAVVRAWNSTAEQLMWVKPGEIIEVWGRLRTYRGEVYISADFARRITAADLDTYAMLMERDREVILKYRGVPANLRTRQDEKEQ